jgi:excisionase family DNA binding protein
MEELTFNDLPKAVSQLLQEMQEIKELLKTLQPPKPTNKPIMIDRACEIIGKARQTVYTLSRLGEIPSYRQGRKVYFFEDELLAWVVSGKKRSLDEIKAEFQNSIYKGTSKNRIFKNL